MHVHVSKTTCFETKGHHNVCLVTFQSKEVDRSLQHASHGYIGLPVTSLGYLGIKIALKYAIFMFDSSKSDGSFLKPLLLYVEGL